jgi:hypothetical protein
MSLTTLAVTLAETGHDEPTIHPYVIGGGALGILITLLLLLLIFGGGREHS